jgi:glycosyltransferase involved in cell wall biosynthesis
VTLKLIYHHRTRSRDGQSVHIDEMIKALGSAGADITLVESQREDPMKPARRKAALPKPVYEILEFGYNFLEFAKLVKAAIRVKPDAIYQRSNIYMLSSVWASRLFRIPLLLEVNAPTAAERGKFNGLAFPALAAWSEKTLWRSADAVFPVTEALAAILRDAGVQPSRILVTSIGIDPAQFHQNVPARRHALKADTILGFVGYVRSWHGLPQVVSLLATDPSLARAGLLVVGDGPARAELEATARELGVQDRVVVTGVVGHEDLPSYVASFDIALQPEVTPYASPLKLFEYMAIGKPIVAPAMDNIREVLEDGTDGLLFTPNDSESLGQAVRTLVKDAGLRARLAAAAVAKVREQDLTWSRNARRAMSTVTRLRRGELS